MTTAADAILSLVHETYRVTMTNGSGTRELVLTGTQRTVWAWCCRAGEARESNLAGYVPVDIRRATLRETGTACTCAPSENYAVGRPVGDLVDL